MPPRQRIACAPKVIVYRTACVLLILFLLSFSFASLVGASDQMSAGSVDSSSVSFSSSQFSASENDGAATITVKRTGNTASAAAARVDASPGTATRADYRRASEFDNSFKPDIKGAVETVLQPDGKLLVATGFQDIDVLSPSVARLNVDGSFDTSFNVTAIETGVVALALQPDGKILVGGRFPINDGTQLTTGVARLNANGSLDSTFTKVVLSTSSEQVTDIVLQPDGKILISGHWFETIHGAPRQGVARLNADGTLDQSFVAAPEVWRNVYKLALQPDGKILVGQRLSPVIVRLNPNGTLDTNFNPGPITEFRNVGNTPRVEAITLQPDGKILIGGQISIVGGTEVWNVARLNTNGTFDPSFNPSFRPYAEYVREIVVQPDGKVIIGYGRSEDYRDGVDALARFNPDGTDDTDFARYKFTGFGMNSSSSVSDIVLTPDDKIIVSGGFRKINNESRQSITRLYGDLFVEWGPGDSSDKTVRLPIVNDQIQEPSETLSLALVPLTSGTTAAPIANATLTILDNTTAAGFLHFSQAIFAVNENEGTATVTVARTSGAQGAVSVAYQTTNGTATSGAQCTFTGNVDYVPASGTLSWAAGDASAKSFTVPLCRNDQREPLAETVNLLLSNPTGGAALGAQSTAVLSIDDQPLLGLHSYLTVEEGDSGSKDVTDDGQYV